MASKLNSLITADFGGAHPLNAILSAASWFAAEPTDEEIKHPDRRFKNVFKNPENFYKWIEDNHITVKHWKTNKLTDDFFFKVRASILKCFKVISINDDEKFDFNVDIKDHRNDIIKKLSTTDIKNYKKLNSFERMEYNYINNYIQIIQNQDLEAKSGSTSFKEMLKFMAKNPKSNDAHKLFYAFSLYDGKRDFKSFYNDPKLKSNYEKKLGSVSETGDETKFAAFCNLMYELNLSKTPGKTCKVFENDSVIKSGSDYLTKPLPSPSKPPYAAKEVMTILPILQDWDDKSIVTEEMKQKFFEKYPHLENIQVADLCEYFNSLSDYYLNSSKTHDFKYFLKNTRTNRDGYPIGHIPGGQADYTWQEIINGNSLSFTSEATKYNNEKDTFIHEFMGIYDHMLDELKNHNQNAGVIYFTSNFNDSTKLMKWWNQYLTLSQIKDGVTILFVPIDYKKKAEWLADPKKYKEFKSQIPELLNEENDRIIDDHNKQETKINDRAKLKF